MAEKKKKPLPKMAPPPIPDVAVPEVHDVTAAMSVMSQSPDNEGGVMDVAGIAEGTRDGNVMNTAKAADESK